MPEREGMDKFHEGQFSPMEGEEIDPEKLKKANKKLQKKHSGQEPGGTFQIDPDAEVPEFPEKKEVDENA